MKPNNALGAGAPEPVDHDASGSNPKPTRGPLQGRSSAPANYNTSGMEGAMASLADKTHKPRR